MLQLFQKNFENINLPKKYNQFIVYSDNRNIGLFHNKKHLRILEIIKKINVDFIVHLGDFVFWDLGWYSFFADLRKKKIDSIILPVRGNHDNLLSFKLLFRMKTQYFVEYEEILLIAIDDNKGFLKPKQLKWLSSILNKFKDKKCKIVFCHKPLYSGASHGVRFKLIEQLTPLFKEFKVNLVFSSHYHNYERLNADDVVYIITAGGGAPLTPLKHKIPQLIIHKTTYNFVLVKVENNCLIISAFDDKEEKIDEIIIK
ncbi:MAG: metallophosphoesterase family protein [Promethearchaeota archaeon]